MSADLWVAADGRTLEDFVGSVTSHGPRPVIGIAGPPGAGKTTAAHHVAAQHGHTAALVFVDGFHLSNVQLRRLGRLDRKGAPDTFDVAGLVTALQRLRTARGEVFLPGFDHVFDEPIAAEHVVESDANLIVVEGNYLLLDDGPWSSVRPLLDAVAFIDEPWDITRSRLVARQLAKGKDRERAEAWVDRSDRANYDVVATTRPRADIVVASQHVV